MFDDNVYAEGYKVISPDWTCSFAGNIKRYKVGEISEQDGPLKLCEKGIHFCRHLFDCFRYYEPSSENHLCKVRALGKVIDGKYKSCTDKLLVIEEISIGELLKSADFCTGICRVRGSNIQYVKTQTPEICLAAVQQDSLALKHAEVQTPEICFTAVQQIGMALKYVNVQTPEICLAAVQQNGMALKYVNVQTPELCLVAVRQDGWALRYVKNQTPEICLAAVQQDGMALKYVNVQTPELCLVAVQQSGWALEYVKIRPRRSALPLCSRTVWP